MLPFLFHGHNVPAGGPAVRSPAGARGGPSPAVKLRIRASTGEHAQGMRGCWQCWMLFVRQILPTALPTFGALKSSLRGLQGARQRWARRRCRPRDPPRSAAQPRSGSPIWTKRRRDKGAGMEWMGRQVKGRLAGMTGRYRPGCTYRTDLCFKLHLYI